MFSAEGLFHCRLSLPDQIRRLSLERSETKTDSGQTLKNRSSTFDSGAQAVDVGRDLHLDRALPEVAGSNFSRDGGHHFADVA
jgi:hypothetical protein